MIFVSVGTHNEQFNRLLEEIDSLIASGKIKDNVIAQIGYSNYLPRNYHYFKFTSWQKILNLNRKADVVITHGGAGNLILASHFNKIIVAVPRMRRYGEHVNDHQIQLVRELEKQRRIIAVYNIKEMSEAIRRAIRKAKNKTKELKFGKRNEIKEKRIISIVKSYIENIDMQKV